MLTASEYSNHSRQNQPVTGPAELNLPRVLWILSSTLEKLVSRNEKLVDELNQELDKLNNGSVRLGKSLNLFHGVRAPGISIPKYLERIYKYTNCSPSCFVVGYVYIDMLTHKHPDSLVLSLNVHRLLVTSVMVASKMLDDEHYNNAVYARVGGVSNAELNKLELELLFLLDFKVMVCPRVFESYCLHLEKEMLVNGTGLKIERILSPKSFETEISVEDQQSSSPPPIVDYGLT
ncbi:putative cyclin [Medicago truncatula]|uniref:Cyclin n=1 Tax=Medicago truncatula TaxID=3880 RepID=G7IKL1_MEDTR|nr:cyclin-U1-1 [Medicago truncatula]AES67281.1 cyclin p4 [Medicago truncatula]RHN75591.1 putative cyclin [Medicago truncatula]